MSIIEDPRSTLLPFRPPYTLSGTCFVAVGLWEREPHSPPPGHSPVRLLGKPLAVLIANHYTEPPADLPIRYHEVIAASLVRRGLTFAAAPFDMVLDAELPVALGRQHYGMPKRLDPALRLVQSAGGVSAHAADLELEARRHGAFASVLALPVRLAFALAVRLVTGTIDVVGNAYPPAQRARIALVPRGVGRSHRLSACSARGTGLRALWCQSWDFTSTVLGAPAPFDTPHPGDA